jgi:hypothetical protein
MPLAEEDLDMLLGQVAMPGRDVHDERIRLRGRSRWAAGQLPSQDIADDAFDICACDGHVLLSLQWSVVGV